MGSTGAWWVLVARFSLKLNLLGQNIGGTTTHQSGDHKVLPRGRKDRRIDGESLAMAPSQSVAKMSSTRCRRHPTVNHWTTAHTISFTLLRTFPLLPIGPAVSLVGCPPILVQQSHRIIPNSPSQVTRVIPSLRLAERPGIISRRRQIHVPVS